MESSSVAARRSDAGLGRLFSELVRLETELWNAIELRLREDHGLPLARFEVMQVIAGRDGCRVQDIAGDLSITVGGASKLVDRIETAGHCRRRPHPQDRRSSLIALSPAGLRVLAAATASFEDELERLLGPALPGRRREQFEATLTRLRAAMRPTDTTQEEDLR